MEVKLTACDRYFKQLREGLIDRELSCLQLNGRHLVSGLVYFSHFIFRTLDLHGAVTCC